MAIHGYKGGVIGSTAPTVSPSSASGVWTLEEQLQNNANWPVTNTLLSDSTRLRSSATAYMSRTPTTAGNRKTWTFSAWIKRGTLSTDQTLFHCYDGSSSRRSTIQFNSDNTIGWDQGGSSTSGLIDTVAVFRDPSAWYHLVCVANYSNGTAANRALIYINNVLQTVTTTDDFDNADGFINSTYAHQIASEGGTSNFFDGYMADVNFIDGQALTPNYFGATNPNTGVWQPAQYHGTYGTNGFYLPMNIEQLQVTFSNSLRFRKSNTAYLSRTPSSASNRRTWTYSVWVKRGLLDTGSGLLDADAGAGATDFFKFNGNTIQFYLNDATSGNVETTAVYRDPAAWYHLVLAVDTTQSTASDRVKIYVNGTQVTALSTASYPTQNYQTAINNTVSHKIGTRGDVSAGNLFDGYMTNINFIDGLQLAPNLFGTTDATSGAWVPVTYAGSYGTNGFFLPFTNATSTTTLGYDFSGLGNNWTTNNISVTAGSTYDSMTDVPTLTSATASNFCVLNSLNIGSDCTLSQANLTVAYGTATTRGPMQGTLGMTTGKWYWEAVCTASSASPTSNLFVGIANKTMPSELGNYPGANAYGWAFNSNGGTVYNNGSSTAYGNSASVNDIIGVAFDADNGKLYFSINGTWQNSGNPATSTNPAFTGLSSDTYFPSIGDGSGASTLTGSINFGQRPFSYTPPTGYVALNTYNM